MRKKTIALDFDGVIHKYSKKWHDGTIYDPPIENAVWAIKKLADKYQLVVFTCRTPIEDVRQWLYMTTGLHIAVTGHKPHADMYIDDRGYHFTGNWIVALGEIERRAKYDFGSDDQWKSAVGI